MTVTYYHWAVISCIATHYLPVSLIDLGRFSLISRVSLLRLLCFPLVVKAFQEYGEPEDANPASPQRRAPTAGEDEAVVLPLSENTLTHNLGIPVLIVCTKVQNKLLPGTLSLLLRPFSPCSFPLTLSFFLVINKYLTLPLHL